MESVSSISDVLTAGDVEDNHGKKKLKHVTGGELLIDGENIENIDLQSLRKHLAVVPQNTILFSGTIRDADRIAVISHGGCVECETYDELMEKKEAFYEPKKLQS